MAIEEVYATRQMTNLWGRSQGRLDKEISLIPAADSSPVYATLHFNRSRKIEDIPAHAEIKLIIRYNLRVEIVELGRIDRFITPEGGTETHPGISLRKFGDRWGDATWQVKVNEPEEPGRVYGWTNPRRINRGEGVISDGKGNEILMVRKTELSDGVAWRMSFPPIGMPTIDVNKIHPMLFDEIKKPTLTSAIIIPEAIGRIIDEMLRAHFQGELTNSGRSTWQGKWLLWIKQKTGLVLPEFSHDESAIECLDWKDDVVEGVKKMISQSSLVGDGIGEVS